MATVVSEGVGAARLNTRQKKSVVFADYQGFSLTTVHVYNEAEDQQPTGLQFQLSAIGGATAELHLGDDIGSTDRASGLVLDFIPPAADYLDLRNRLKAQQVCLETCSVQEHLLSGTVQVRNLSFEKCVWVRITFDSWCSFQDVPCRYLKNVYSCLDTDTFSFSVPVPEALQPTHTVQFCLQYQTPDHTFWDNNHGNNYRLAAANGGPAGDSEHAVGLAIQGGQTAKKTEFDPLGSPRTSAGIFPEWQSCGRTETSAPYW